MTEREQQALQIFCALLARDPLPAQRFTDITIRIEQLARVALLAAEAFHEVHGTYEENAVAFRAASATLWNRHSTPTPDIKPSAKGVPPSPSDCAPAESDLITQMGPRR